MAEHLWDNVKQVENGLIFQIFYLTKDTRSRSTRSRKERLSFVKEFLLKTTVGSKTSEEVRIQKVVFFSLNQSVVTPIFVTSMVAPGLRDPIKIRFFQAKHLSIVIQLLVYMCEKVISYNM